ncbi:MAG: MFS transporter [Acidimicrobiia bacterium]|nr:MFS transporter [Acidimicrobiia bacterium]
MNRPTRTPLLVIFSVTLTGIMANTLPNPALPDIVAEFDRSPGEAGIFVAAGALPGIVMAPLIGILADRFGRRAVLVPCLVVFGAFGLAGSAAPTFEALVASRLAQGVGSAGLINLAIVLIADSWDGTTRARYIGWNAAVLTVSVAVFPVLGGGLAELGGWRWSFFPYAFSVVAAVAVALTVPNRTRQTVTLRSQLGRAVTVLRQPAVAGAIVYGGLLFVLIFGLFLTALPLLLADRFDMGPGQRGLVLASPALGSTTAALLLGRLRRALGARRLLVAGAVLFGVGFVAVGTSPVLVGLVVGAVIYGLGEGASIPTVQDIVAGAAPDESRGAVVATWVGSARFGQATGPLVVGLAIAGIGPDGAFLAGAVVAAAMVATLVLVRLPAIRVPETPTSPGAAV